MSMFYCLRIERNISLFKRCAWTCLYNVGPRNRTVVLGYEVQHYILETKWRRVRGRTWLEKNDDMPMFSLKNSEEIQNGGAWRYIRWQLWQLWQLCFCYLFKFVYMHLVRWLEKRDHTQSVTQQNTLFIFRVFTKKKSNACYGGDVFLISWVESKGWKPFKTTKDANVSW